MAVQRIANHPRHGRCAVILYTGAWVEGRRAGARGGLIMGCLCRGGGGDLFKSNTAELGIEIPRNRWRPMDGVPHIDTAQPQSCLMDDVLAGVMLGDRTAIKGHPNARSVRALVKRGKIEILDGVPVLTPGAVAYYVDYLLTSRRSVEVGCGNG